MRIFVLERNEDVSGVSGTGVVAEGVEFWDGSCAMRWREPVGHQSVSFYNHIEDVEFIHGHGGSTTIRFVDTIPE
jgi:hypothetical protein